jgi:hypothetical protein
MFKWRREKNKKNKCVIPLEPPSDGNGHADKNEYFSVRGATQTDTRRWRCPNEKARVTFVAPNPRDLAAPRALEM